MSCFFFYKKKTLLLLTTEINSIHFGNGCMFTFSSACSLSCLTRLWSWAFRWTAQGCWRWSSRCGWPAPAGERPPVPHREPSTCCRWCLGSRLVTVGLRSPPLLGRIDRGSPGEDGQWGKSAHERKRACVVLTFKRALDSHMSRHWHVPPNNVQF